MKSFIIVLFVGLNMLGFLSDLFGRGEPEVGKLYPREINITGNIFRFSIPENFSKDMPADDLIDVVTEQQLARIKSDGYLILMRRWWDLKEKGFLGKELGTLMMSISLKKRPAKKLDYIDGDQYYFKDFLGFVVALNDSLLQRYEEHNKQAVDNGDYEFSIYVTDIATLLGEKISSGYELISVNNNSWVKAEAIQSKNIERFYATPLSDDFFLEVSFQIMPNDNVVPFRFLDVCTDHTRVLVNTFNLSYAAKNKYSKITSEQWKGKSVVGELQSRNINLFPEEDNSSKALE